MFKRRNNAMVLRPAAKTHPNTTKAITSEAFGDAYQDELYDLCIRILRGYGFHNDAEDLVQTVILRCWERRAQLREPESMKPWVTTAIRYAFFSEARKPKRYCQLENADADVPSSSDQEAIERAAAICFVKNLCSPGQWHLLDSVHLHGGDPEDVARELGITPNALHKRLSRLYCALRKKMFGATTRASRRDRWERR